MNRPPSKPLETSRIKYRAVILDYGLVLCRMPARDRTECMAQLLGVSQDKFWELFERHRGTYDRGELTPSEYWTRLAEDAESKLNSAAIEQLRAWDLAIWMDIESAMIEWVVRLKAAGYKTAILSNMNLELIDKVRKSFAWVSKFDSQVFSAEARMIKPEPAIFRRCLNELGVPGNEAVFVDDRESNIKAASEEEMAGIRFVSVPQLRSDLEEMGFDVLPTATDPSQ